MNGARYLRAVPKDYSPLGQRLTYRPGGVTAPLAAVALLRLRDSVAKNP